MAGDERKDDELLALFDRGDEAAAEALQRRCAESPPDREVVAAAALLERLLGPASDAHPSSTELCALADDCAPAGAREAVEAHLASCATCRDLHAAVVAGLAEGEEIERGLRVLAAQQRPASAAATIEAEVAVLHLPLAVTQPAARALAAGAEPPPLPQERRLLATEDGCFDLVYLRSGGRAQLGLFSERRDELQVAVTLDRRALDPIVDDEGAVLFDLGPVGALFGQRLEVSLNGAARGSWSWTVVESLEPGGSDPS